MGNTTDRLKRIICDYIDVQPEDIDVNSNFKFDIGMDSFGMISLINSIESEFNVSIPDNKIKTFNTLLDVSNFLDEAQSA